MNSLRSDDRTMTAISKEQWDFLSQSKIYFGHQSVGQNILDGILDHLRMNPGVKLNIKETTDPGDFRGPVFAHSSIGRNMDPVMKIDHFRSILEGGIGEKADIALFKLCFIDIDHKTDIESLFRHYTETIDGLRAKFPDLSILPVTVPLTVLPGGIKARIKKVLGRTPPHKEDNIKRNMFNALLRRKYGKLVYDLAGIESTRSNGKRVFFGSEPEPYYLLSREFTDDGGHLNKTGRLIVAGHLLRNLVDAGQRPQVR